MNHGVHISGAFNTDRDQAARGPVADLLKRDMKARIRNSWFCPRRPPATRLLGEAFPNLVLEQVREMARGELVRLLHPLLAREQNGRFPGHAGDVVEAGGGHFVVPSRLVSGAVLSADAA